MGTAFSSSRDRQRWSSVRGNSRASPTNRCRSGILAQSCLKLHGTGAALWEPAMRACSRLGQVLARTALPNTPKDLPDAVRPGPGQAHHCSPAETGLLVCDIVKVMGLKGFSLTLVAEWGLRLFLKVPRSVCLQSQNSCGILPTLARPQCET